MQNKAWNQYSSSSDSDVEDNDNDSWFDDDKEENQKTPRNVTNNEEKEQSAKVEETRAPISNQQATIQNVQNRTEDNQKKYEKKKFPSDEQLLNLYVSKQVDNTKAIKVAKVRSEETKQLIKDTKTRKTVEIGEDTFIMFFETEEDLISFVKQKIEKRSRFFLQQFFESKNKKNEREGKYKGKEQNIERRPRRDRPQENQKDDNKRDMPERKQKVDNPPEQKKKKRYENQEDSEEQEKRQKKMYEQKKQQTRDIERQQGKSKKVYLPKQYFQIPQKSNSLKIISDNFENDRILQELERKRVFKDFAKFYIEAPFYALKKVAILCNQLGSKKKFYLQKQPPHEGEKDAIVKLTMIENHKKNHTECFFQRYKPKAPQESHIRLLGEKSEEYFKNIEKYNVSEIVKGFDQNKYITQLRDASQNIQKYWNCWKLQAEEDNIEMLLRLSNRIKKSTIYDLQLKPSLRDQKALLTAELKQRPQKERRPKVDVSNVNNYLS